jgi:hypothetical protein
MGEDPFDIHYSVREKKEDWVENLAYKLKEWSQAIKNRFLSKRGLNRKANLRKNSMVPSLIFFMVLFFVVILFLLHVLFASQVDEGTLQDVVRVELLKHNAYDYVPWSRNDANVRSKQVTHSEYHNKLFDSNDGLSNHPLDFQGVLYSMRFVLKRENASFVCARELGVQKTIFAVNEHQIKRDDNTEIYYNCAMHTIAYSKGIKRLKWSHKSLFSNAPPEKRTIAVERYNTIVVSCLNQHFETVLKTFDEPISWNIQNCFELDKGVSLF